MTNDISPASPSTPAIPQRATINTLAEEAKKVGSLQLTDFLNATGREITDVYRGATTWTAILRRAKLVPAPATAPPGEAALLKRMHSFLHVDDAERASAYQRLTTDDAPSYDSLDEWDQTLARMLFFNLWDKGGFTTYAVGLASLRPQHAVRSELSQVLAYLLTSDRMHDGQPLGGAHVHIPLSIHHAYNRSEILAALGVARLGGQMPGYFAQGVLWDEANRTDALLITLNKSERDFSPTVRYKDYAISRTEFHWESQNATAPDSHTGQRYQKHTERRSHVLLFMRESKDTAIGKAMPWVLLGPGTYKSHTGTKPMAITWQLHNLLPDRIWSQMPASQTAS
ncbi:DUF3427 domain-containing protein [Streptomyces goshikiensis]|uniref:DUF3427 domain-containing protein n=1 Tax=Streptomyces goshikiensis TaxID=1942 RepID=UPI003803B2FA